MLFRSGFLGGCFHPLYGDRTVTGGPNIRDRLAAVDVSQIKAPNGTSIARLAVELRNDLIFDLTGGSGGIGATHRLVIQLSSTTQQVIVDVTTAEILARFPRMSALVVGDVCLDRWCVYDPAATEPSRETGIPRIGVVRTEVTPGAAGHRTCGAAASTVPHDAGEQARANGLHVSSLHVVAAGQISGVVAPFIHRASSRRRNRSSSSSATIALRSAWRISWARSGQGRSGPGGGGATHSGHGTKAIPVDFAARRFSWQAGHSNGSMSISRR